MHLKATLRGPPLLVRGRTSTFPTKPSSLQEQALGHPLLFAILASPSPDLEKKVAPCSACSAHNPREFALKCGGDDGVMNGLACRTMASGFVG